MMNYTDFTKAFVTYTAL